MPKIFSNEQKNLVRQLYDEGKNHTQIATVMCERFPADWNAKDSSRTVARIVKEFKSEEPVVSSKTLDEMSREERFRHISASLENTPRFKMAFRNFTVEQKSVFIDEYLSVIRSTETLTEVEEQALFSAILELILAFQALNRKETEEKLRDDSLAGKIPETDIRFRRNVDDKYHKEYDQHMKLYQKGMSELKMSRSQRLQEVRTQKVSLVDLAEELSNKNAQSEVADEIARLAKMKDDELKRLLDLGHLHGIFEQYN